MDVLSSGAERTPSRRRRASPGLVGAALVALAAGQAAALLGPRALPPAVALEALPNGFSYSVLSGDTTQLGFQLRNSGDRLLRVSTVASDLPGLDLVDVVASGEPFAFTEVGAGSDPLPAFDLPAGTVIEIGLVYRVESCELVPRDARPVPVTVETGRSRGTLALALPGLPAEAVDAAPDDEDPWQQVLVRDLCG